MKLTEKAEEDFYKWIGTELIYLDNHNFKDFGDSMQYGLLVDFFDSVGIMIFEDFNPLNGGRGTKIYRPKPNTWKCERIGGMVMLTDCTRQEARTKSIEKANEIYNNKKTTI